MPVGTKRRATEVSTHVAGLLTFFMSPLIVPPEQARPALRSPVLWLAPDDVEHIYDRGTSCEDRDKHAETENAEKPYFAR